MSELRKECIMCMKFCQHPLELWPGMTQESVDMACMGLCTDPARMKKAGTAFLMVKPRDVCESFEPSLAYQRRIKDGE